jgi:hypothetical protein
LLRKHSQKRVIIFVMRRALLIVLLLLPAIVLVGCAGSPVEDREAVGRGSAGGTAREMDAPSDRGAVDTMGLPTVVFVDSDG